MSKLISLALAKPIGTIIGLLAVISIAPNSEAMNANIQPSSLQQPAGNLQLSSESANGVTLAVKNGNIAAT